LDKCDGIFAMARILSLSSDSPPPKVRFYVPSGSLDYFQEATNAMSRLETLSSPKSAVGPIQSLSDIIEFIPAVPGKEYLLTSADIGGTGLCTDESQLFLGVFDTSPNASATSVAYILSRKMKVRGGDPSPEHKFEVCYTGGKSPQNENLQVELFQNQAASCGLFITEQTNLEWLSSKEAVSERKVVFCNLSFQNYSDSEFMKLKIRSTLPEELVDQAGYIDNSVFEKVVWLAPPTINAAAFIAGNEEQQSLLLPPPPIRIPMPPSLPQAFQPNVQLQPEIDFQMYQNWQYQFLAQQQAQQQQTQQQQQAQQQQQQYYNHQAQHQAQAQHQYYQQAQQHQSHPLPHPYPHPNPHALSPRFRSNIHAENRVFVGGLDWLTTEEDLRVYFGKFGDVQTAELKTKPTGEPRGFAFVTFSHEGAVEKCVSPAGSPKMPHSIRMKSIDVQKFNCLCDKCRWGREEEGQK
tara:strand:+ start:535 stop:1926 length:1392 start_codon:yes stop_codon:yes gene_type:complete